MRLKGTAANLKRMRDKCLPDHTQCQITKPEIDLYVKFGMITEDEHKAILADVPECPKG